MYVESACYDPNTIQEGGLIVSEDGFSQTMSNCNPNFSMEDLSSYHHHHHHQEDGGGSKVEAEMEMQQQMGLDMNHLIQQESGLHDSYDHHSNWDTNNNNDVVHNQDFQQHLDIQNGHIHHQTFNNNNQEPPYPPTPDLLNLLHLPRCSLPNSTLSFMNPNHQHSASFSAYLGDIPPMETAAASSVMYDPLFHLNLPPQPPVFRDLFQSLPHGYTLPGSRTGSLFSGVDEREVSTGAGVYQDGEARHFDNGIFEFNREIKCIPKGKNGKGGTKHFATERERRENLNDKYKALRNLVPSPTKQDRASVVGDAIGYIEELKRTVNELTLLVEKKRCARERIKRQKTTDDSGGAATGEAESCNIKAEPDQSYNGSSALRSSWLQRKSKGTEVDVRIIDDEVTIKLAQRKKINCLLIVSRLLDEFQLEIHHVAGGLVGDNYSFLFNSKICEGSSVYASAIASKLIEVVDRQYAGTPPTSSCY